MCTVPTAATKPCRTETTFVIWLMGTCITHTRVIATITAPWKSSDSLHCSSTRERTVSGRSLFFSRSETAGFGGHHERFADAFEVLPNTAYLDGFCGGNFPVAS